MIKKLINKIRHKWSIYKYTKWYNKASPYFYEHPEEFLKFLDMLEALPNKNRFEECTLRWGKSWVEHKNDSVKLHQERCKIVKEIYGEEVLAKSIHTF